MSKPIIKNKVTPDSLGVREAVSRFIRKENIHTHSVIYILSFHTYLMLFHIYLIHIYCIYILYIIYIFIYFIHINIYI